MDIKAESPLDHSGVETINMKMISGHPAVENDATNIPTPISPSDSHIRYQRTNGFLDAMNGVKSFVRLPFIDQEESEKQAQDTLSALEPFFWLLRILGLCSRARLFTSSNTPSLDQATKTWNYALLVYVVIVGIFLWLGFIVTFGFSMAWPIAFCAGFQTMMFTNQSYCEIDVMERFLTLKGLNTLIQSSFLFIGAVNMVVAATACVRIGPMVKLLREYYTITPAAKFQSHRRVAFAHAALTVATAAVIGIPFTFVYESMLNEIRTEKSYEGYPFANIDTPLVKIENWIAYTRANVTDSKTQKFILTSLKYVFRAENFFSFLSCFAVPFFFSLMCAVLGKEWKRFVAFLQQDSCREKMSPELLRNIRNSHWMLCKLIGLIDECFSFMILIIYIMFIVINSSITYIVLKFGANASGQDRHAFYQAILMFAALEIVFYLVIRQAMRLHGTTKLVTMEIRDWQPVLDGVMDSEYMLLLNQVTTTDVSFTAWNCFRIEEAAYINLFQEKIPGSKNSFRFGFQFSETVSKKRDPSLDTILGPSLRPTLSAPMFSCTAIMTCMKNSFIGVVLQALAIIFGYVLMMLQYQPPGSN